ncbi:hypothetical protein N7495_009433 [Penicillium taxi]|uniref:uncharacterized protein n=1 Tax=Penicillium taxi TaxID=168475 RepID=UPI00254542E8|nr:uncharacterized protein N7495_009433 [Penicillium taxi]KAJ5884923.1 hypothetical protein N7495_009433 [Penicillium taxi]
MIPISPKPTILLIAGGWSRARTYEPVAAILRNQGYDARTITLPSAGGPPSSTAIDDVNYIQQNYLNDLIDEGKEVVIAMHSYSGLPGTQCVQGFSRKELASEDKKGGVVGLVYITAYLLAAGETVESSLPGGLESHMRIDGDVVHLKDEQKAKFFNSISEEYSRRYADALTYHTIASLKTPLTYEAYRDVPSTYLFCDNDECLPVDTQRAMAALPGRGFTRMYRCSAGHFPMLSMPEGVAFVIHDSIMKNIMEFSNATSSYPFLGNLELEDGVQGTTIPQPLDIEHARCRAGHIDPGLRWLLY